MGWELAVGLIGRKGTLLCVCMYALCIDSLVHSAYHEQKNWWPSQMHHDKTPSKSLDLPPHNLGPMTANQEFIDGSPRQSLLFHSLVRHKKALSSLFFVETLTKNLGNVFDRILRCLRNWLQKIPICGQKFSGVTDLVLFPDFSTDTFKSYCSSTLSYSF